MFGLKRPQPLTKEQSRKAVPVKNESVEETRTATGEVVLYLPRKEAGWIKVLSKVLYIPKGRKVALDELGTTVWDWLDGQVNVEQVIKKFAEKYRLSKREAELSVVAYLRTLAKRGLVGIAVFDDPAPEGKAGGRKHGNKKKKKKKR